MFQVENAIISEEIIKNHFVCNLNACKGACCVDGEAGAPLEQEETEILQTLYPKIKPFLRQEGINAIEKQGTSVIGIDNEPETPLINGKECAYATFDQNGIARCGIEQAYTKKAIDWKKPISCHLYPIRITTYNTFTAVNYHKWQICNPACSLGKSTQTPIYKFVKEALIRKFGENWYNQLEKMAKMISISFRK